MAVLRWLVLLACSAQAAKIPRAAEVLAAEGPSQTVLSDVQSEDVLTDRDDAPSGKMYTTNQLCIRNLCVNPLVPGLGGLGESLFEAYEKVQWQCPGDLRPRFANASFCDRVVASYPFSLPASVGSTLEELALQQDQKAIVTFTAHMTSLGYDLWSFTKPWEHGHEQCVQQVWKMACFAHFPRCNDKKPAMYLRPCKNGCSNYLSKCRVECCDEGAQCLLEFTSTQPDGTLLTQTGFAPSDGPSPFCTGSANSVMASPLLFAALTLAAFIRGL